MKAVVISPICPLMTEPKPDCELADEALFGMVVEVLEEPNADYRKVRTHYRYEGYVPAKCLLFGDDTAAAWEAKPKKIILTKNFADVMTGPKVQSWPIVTLPLGAVVAETGEKTEDGEWTLVALPDGRTGWVRTSWLGVYYDAPRDLPEEELRQEIVKAAWLYRRTQYRWGGKTPAGMDCSGLASMSYLLNGILIYRDAKILPGFPLIEIPKDEMKPGDLLFFPGHVAVYIGDGRYLHSTGKAGSDGFDINSLDPADPLFRADLLEKLYAVGSYEGFHQ